MSAAEADEEETVWVSTPVTHARVRLANTIDGDPTED